MTWKETFDSSHNSTWGILSFRDLEFHTMSDYQTDILAMEAYKRFVQVSHPSLCSRQVLDIQRLLVEEQERNSRLVKELAQSEIKASEVCVTSFVCLNPDFNELFTQNWEARD